MASALVSSSSVVINQRNFHTDDADIANSLVKAQQSLNDVLSKDGLKGKGRRRGGEEEEAGLNDEEVAAKLQLEYLQQALDTMEDFNYANSLNSSRRLVRDDLVHQRAKMALAIKAGLPSCASKSEHHASPAEASYDFRSGFGAFDDFTGVAQEEREEHWDDKSVPDVDMTVCDHTAAEYRRANLLHGINVGRPGPSNVQLDIEDNRNDGKSDIEDIADFGRDSSTSQGPKSPSNDKIFEDNVKILENPFNDPTAPRSAMSLHLGPSDTISNIRRGSSPVTLPLSLPFFSNITPSISSVASQLLSPLAGVLNNSASREPSPAASHPGSPIDDPIHLHGVQNGFPTIICFVCGDLVVGEPTLKAPCGHDHCVDCIEDNVTNATTDESLFPPRCCTQPIPIGSLSPFLTRQLEVALEQKRKEYDVPAGFRLFCPNPKCSRFLGSSEGVVGDIICTACKVPVCPRCKQYAHYGETCDKNTGAHALRRLAEDKRWQLCPGCKTYVETMGGCPHMICRCSFSFCYFCGAKWKTCKC